jgi:hypothetical protein
VIGFWLWGIFMMELINIESYEEYFCHLQPYMFNKNDGRFTLRCLNLDAKAQIMFLSFVFEIRVFFAD